MARTFTAGDRFVAEHPTAIALYCSDGRFTRAVEELLRHLGHERLDTLTMPGGPALLVPAIAQVAENQAVRKATAFLITGHALTEAVLLAHQGCGFYRQRLPRDAPEAIVRRQRADLTAAAAELTREHPRLRVHLYFAAVQDDAVRFDGVG
jgi:hypothetical protein